MKTKNNGYYKVMKTSKGTSGYDVMPSLNCESREVSKTHLTSESEFLFFFLDMVHLALTPGMLIQNPLSLFP